MVFSRFSGSPSLLQHCHLLDNTSENVSEIHLFVIFCLLKFDMVEDNYLLYTVFLLLFLSYHTHLRIYLKEYEEIA